MRKIKFHQMILKLKNDERVVFLNCESSNVDSVAYNFDQNELVVVFQNSPQYRYHYEEVDAKVFFKLATANSVGSFVTNIVKKGYEFRKKANK